MPMLSRKQVIGKESTIRTSQLIVLTLGRHKTGIWITKLVERLKQTVPNHHPFQHAEISIVALEDWLADGWLVSHHDGKNRGMLGIINRVSDAAPPALFKACCALLAVAETSLRIPVWNGSTAYSLCGNKWRHHILFRQAKLSAPTTMVYHVEQGKGPTIVVDPRLFRQSATGTTEVLVKPNAGGFGAGIKRISMPPFSAAESKPITTIAIPSSFEDGMALVQQYETPPDKKIYRVWFLRGKVQCATERMVHVAKDDAGEQNDDGTAFSEFTSGCAGGKSCTFSVDGSQGNQNAAESLSSNSDQPACARSSPASSLPSTVPDREMRPWKISEEVRADVEDRLLPLLADAHCGSVEFLHSPCGVATTHSPVLSDDLGARAGVSDGRLPLLEIDNGKGYRRLYFDLNLLSTLPLTDEGNDDAKSETEGAVPVTWRKGFDPWLELALAVWEFCVAGNQPCGRAE